MILFRRASYCFIVIGMFVFHSGFYYLRKISCAFSFFFIYISSCRKRLQTQLVHKHRLAVLLWLMSVSHSVIHAQMNREKFNVFIDVQRIVYLYPVLSFVVSSFTFLFSFINSMMILKRHCAIMLVVHFPKFLISWLFGYQFIIVAFPLR